MSKEESKIANTISNAFVSSNDVHAISGITNMVDAIREVASALEEIAYALNKCDTLNKLDLILKPFLDAAERHD